MNELLGQEEQVKEFLEGTKWEKAERTPFKSKFGYSAKRFEQLKLDEKAYLLMQCHEYADSFARVSDELRRLGYSSPEVFAREGNFLILEFLDGRVFNELPEPELKEAIRIAVDLLADMHNRFDNQDEHLHLPDFNYSDHYYSRWNDLFPVWGMPAILEARGQQWTDVFRDASKGGTGYPPREILTRWRETWQALHKTADKAKNTLMMLDYHSPNLIYLEQREGLKRIGITDFQDAVIGPATYDLVSIIQDARIKIPRDFQNELLERYIRRAEIDDMDAFLNSYYIFGTRRNIRNVGSWYRFGKAKGKPEYIKRHAPLNWHYLEDCLKHPALDSIRGMIEPFAPTEEEKLK